MPSRHQHHHYSPTETAARLTFRRAPSFSSPVNPLAGTRSGSGGGSKSSALFPMSTLRALFGGTTTGAFSPSSSSSSTARRTHVGFEDEMDDDRRGAGAAAAWADDGVLPLKMTLGRFNGEAGGRTRMVFTDQGWQVDDDLRRAYERRIHELTEELAEVEHAALASRSQCQQLEEARAGEGVLRFKNRLLVEMLAIAQLDEAAAREALERERAKSEEYRKELERCYARMLGLGIDPGSIPSSEARGQGGGGGGGGTTSGSRSPSKRRA